uniref:Uncharacterized protein n=1 Tax=Romanomermis culicivorax TaxID=13658 RepID=A0A915JTS2_ROMCU
MIDAAIKEPFIVEFSDYKAVERWADPLGNVVQDALANVLDGGSKALKAKIAHKVATTEAGLNELRIGHL